MIKWAYVAVIVGSTTVGEVLGAFGMRRHGEIRGFSPNAIGRALAALSQNRYVVGSVFCMAVSFFAFMGLLTVAELSFAGPITAVSFALETVMAKFILKERVTWLRWAGALLVIGGVSLVGPS
jgi:drug/metabolite transporter (DMT)-like permease